MFCVWRRRCSLELSLSLSLLHRSIEFHCSSSEREASDFQALSQKKSASSSKSERTRQAPDQHAVQCSPDPGQECGIRARVWQGATKLEEELKCAGALEAWAHASSVLHCVLQSKLHTQKFAHATHRLLVPSTLLDGTSSSPDRYIRRWLGRPSASS